MIDAKTEISTRELCAVLDVTKGRLSQLENAGIIKRSGRDQWPLAATMRALIADARGKSDAHSAARARLENVRAQREELRLKREAHDLCRTAEFDTAVDFMAGSYLRHYGAVPARFFPHDLPARRRLEDELRIAQAGVSDDCQRQSESLHARGKAA